MPSRGRKIRDRWSETSLSSPAESNRRSASKAIYNTEFDIETKGSSGSNSRSSTPVNNMNSRPQRRGRSKNKPKSKSRPETQQQIMNRVLSLNKRNSDSESDFDDEMSVSVYGSNKSPDFLDDDNISELNHDTQSILSESSFGTPKKVSLSVSPVSPYLDDEHEVPTLVLPKSSSDLIFEGHLLLETVGIYEVLRHFWRILRLSPFHMEEFSAALITDDKNILISEIHISLLRSLLREDDSINTTYGPLDLKDSINAALYFIDTMTWYEIARSYIEGYKNKEYTSVLKYMKTSSYGSLSVKNKIEILQALVNLFLSTNPVRDEINNEGNIHYDEHCRVCQKLGDLLCCETCSAVYHLYCVDPPLDEVPDDDWRCSFCRENDLNGVTNCISEAEKNGLLYRHEPLGYDRNKRKYWFLCRRLFVESEEEVFYYSSPRQFEELYNCLDSDKLEYYLCQALNHIKEELFRQMKITFSITISSKGSKSSILEKEEANLENLQNERERKRREELKLLEKDNQACDEETGENLKQSPEQNELTNFGDQPMLLEDDMSVTETVVTTTCDGEETGDIDETPLVESSADNVKDESGSSNTIQNENDVSNNKSDLITESKPKTLNSEESLSNVEKETPKNINVCKPYEMKSKPSISVVNFSQVNLFKLGMELSYKHYKNKFSVNNLALTKTQQAEDRDKKRHMSHKFSLTSGSDFKWNGASTGQSTAIVLTLRSTILQLEQSLLSPFLHPNWALHRSNWSKAVNMCNSPSDFGLALAILEACIKPAVFNPVWYESLGHLSLNRITQLEREEIKKKEKEQRKNHDDEDIYRNRWVKYTLGLKHQVWKMKGEEFRIAGSGGWLWVSSLRNYKFIPQNEIGLRKIAAKVQQKKSLNGSLISDIGKCETKDCVEKSDFNNFSHDNIKTEEPSLTADTNFKESLDNNSGVINISSCLRGESKSGNFYVKVTKPYSRLDLLLERRQKQAALEEKKQAAIEQVIAKFKLKEKSHLRDSNKKTANKCFKSSNTSVKKFSCYSYSCRSNEESCSTCYSPSCNAELFTASEDNVEKKLLNGSLLDHTSDNDEDSDVDIENTDSSSLKSAAVLKSKSNVSNTNDDDDQLKVEEPPAPVRPTKPSSIGSMIDGLIQGGKITLTNEKVADLEAKLAYVGLTSQPVSLLRQTRGRGSYKSRTIVKKGSLAACQKFCLSKSNPIGRKCSPFILERHELRKLARTCGHREASGFNYTCKMTNVNWLYPCPRPLFKTTWRFRTQTLQTFASAAMQLRILWACLNWDGMHTKMPSGGTNTITTETDITTTEVLKRRDVGVYGLRSEYFVRKIIIPIGLPSTPRTEKYTPIRSGLRERKRPESPKQRDPVLSEKWIPEESLELWEIKSFSEKYEKQKAIVQEKINVAQQLTPKTPESVAILKQKMEEQLKQQRVAMQQKRQTTFIKRKQADGTVTLIGTPSSSSSASLNHIDSEGNNRIVKVVTSGPSSTSSITQCIQIAPRTTAAINAQSSNGQYLTPAKSDNPVQLRAKTNTPIIAQQPNQPVITSAIVIQKPGQMALKPGTIQTVKIRPASNSPDSEVQMLQLIPQINGQIQVKGLRQGQQIIKMADGRLQLITMSAAQQSSDCKSTHTLNPTAHPPSATVPKIAPRPTGGISVTLNASVPSVTAAGTLPASAVTPAVPSGSASVRQVLITQQAGLSSNNTIMKQVVRQHQVIQPSSVVSTSSTTNLTQLLVQTPGGGPPRQITVQLQPDGSLPHLWQQQVTGSASTPVQQSEHIRLSLNSKQQKDVLLQQQSGLSQVPVSLLSRSNAQVLGGSVSPAKSTFITSSTNSSSQIFSTKINTSMSTSNQSHQKVTKKSDVKHPDSFSHSGVTISPAAGNPSIVTPQVVEQVVRQAMLQNQDPEIQAKLMAMQKQIQSQQDNPNFKISATLLSNEDEHPHSLLSSQSAKMDPKLKNLTYLQRQEFLRNNAVALVMNNMLTEVSKILNPNHLVVEPNKKKSDSVVNVEREKKPETPNNKRKTSARKEKQHSKYDKSSFVSELPDEILQTSPPDYTLKSEVQSSRKRKLLKSGAGKVQEKLYCICKQPYDETKFYIGCDLCSNWFHGTCVKISRSTAKKISSFVCLDCKEQQEEQANELYCLCQTPYDDNKFYIGCDQCQDWFHGTCVNITKEQADSIDTYLCPRCSKSPPSKRNNDKQLTDTIWDEMSNLVVLLQNHKMSWPFLQPVDSNQVSDYYEVIKEPMDLETVFSKIRSKSYVNLEEFSKDVSRIFDNCRYYNPSDSAFFKCAEVLEVFFAQKFKPIRDKYNPSKKIK